MKLIDLIEGDKTGRVDTRSMLPYTRKELNEIVVNFFRLQDYQTLKYASNPFLLYELFSTHTITLLWNDEKLKPNVYFKYKDCNELINTYLYQDKNDNFILMRLKVWNFYFVTKTINGFKLNLKSGHLSFMKLMLGMQLSKDTPIKKLIRLFSRCTTIQKFKDYLITQNKYKLKGDIKSEHRKLFYGN